MAVVEGAITMINAVATLLNSAPGGSVDASGF